MLLYAGITKIFKYTILYDVVKKLKISKSAGNIFKNRTSETLSNGIIAYEEKFIN